MEKRAFERVDSYIQVYVYHDNGIYEGAVRNLSKNGLYIDMDTFTPCESAIMVVLVHDDKVFKLGGKVKRTVNTNELRGIGVGLVNPSQSYFKFVSSAMDYCNQTLFKREGNIENKEGAMKKGSKKKSAVNLIEDLAKKYKKTFNKAENNGIKKKYLKSNSLCKVTFRLPKEAAPEAQNVTIAGDFNDWNANETLMKRLKDGTFTATVNLERDREYQFRYLIDSARWENDWNADKYIKSTYGDHDNSVILT